MVLSLKDPERDRLAREVTRPTDETLTVAVRTGLAAGIEREPAKRRHPASVHGAIKAVVMRIAALPALGSRTADRIRGYDENGPDAA